MTMTTNSTRDWVVAAADRAERRSRGQLLTARSAPTDPTTTLVMQLETLVAAILDAKVTRARLCRLAEAVKVGARA
jgi:hypothetical protein